MTSFATELARLSVTYVTDTLPRLIYKDVYLLTFHRLIYLSFNQLPIMVAQILPSASGASMLGKKVRSARHNDVNHYGQLVTRVFLCDELTGSRQMYVLAARAAQ